MPNFEGEYMKGSQTEQESEAKIIATGTLGPNNLGSIGPASESEAKCSLDLGNPEYSSHATDESHCMDDRLEVLGIQLAGNRAVTEVSADFLDPQSDNSPLSRSLPRKVAELIAMGRTPNFHEGCAALALASLPFMAAPAAIEASMIWRRFSMARSLPQCVLLILSSASRS